MSTVGALLSAMPLVQGLSDDDRARLEAIGSVEEPSTGTVLFREGEPSEALWLVVSGRVGLSMRCPGRPETLLLTLGPGEMLGWTALQADGHRVATGRVSERATLVRLPRDEVRALCEQDHDIGYALMTLAFQEVSARLRDTRLQLLDMFGVGSTCAPPPRRGQG